MKCEDAVPSRASLGTVTPVSTVGNETSQRASAELSGLNSLPGLYSIIDEPVDATLRPILCNEQLDESVLAQVAQRPRDMRDSDLSVPGNHRWRCWPVHQSVQDRCAIRGGDNEAYLIPL